MTSNDVSKPSTDKKEAPSPASEDVSIETIINLAKREEGEAVGLTEKDMMAILNIMRHTSRLDNTLLKMVPVLEIALPSGLRGKLIWRRNTGYVFSFDSLSVFNL